MVGGRRAGTVKLHQSVPEDGGKLGAGLVDDEGGEVPVPVVPGDDLGEFFPPQRTPGILVGFEQHVSDHFPDQLLLLLGIEILFSTSNPTSSDKGLFFYLSGYAIKLGKILGLTRHRTNPRELASDDFFYFLFFFLLLVP